MTEFTSVQLFLCLILALTFTVTKQSSSSVIVRGGDEVLLACENMMGPINCLRIHWLFSKPADESAADLVKFGRTNQTQAARPKADRLGVSSNCSLVIQRVSAADVGTYYCLQVQNGKQKETRHTVALSVVHITEEKDDEEVTLKCSVTSGDSRKHDVNWLFRGQIIDEHNTDMEIENSACTAEVTFKSSHYVNEPGSYNLLQCKVAESGGKQQQQFPFRAQTPGKKNKESKNTEAEQPSGMWWLYIVVVVVLAAFLLAVGFFMKRKRNKGNKTGVHENQGLNSLPAASHSASELNQDSDEPDTSISYASINLPKKNNNQVWGRDATVTYSAVRIGISPDPSHLYVSVK